MVKCRTPKFTNLDPGRTKNYRHFFDKGVQQLNISQTIRRKLTGYPKSAYSPVQYGWIFAMAVVVFLMAVVMMMSHGALYLEQVSTTSKAKGQTDE